jgi:hypothetical protein
MNYAGFLQLGAKSGNARTRYFGEPGVICIGDNFEQPLDTNLPMSQLRSERVRPSVSISRSRFFKSTALMRMAMRLFAVN